MEEVKGWTLGMLGKKFTTWLLVIAVLLFALIFAFVPEYSSFAASLLKGAIGIAVFFLFDKYVLKEVDSIEELKRNNIAYAIFLATVGGIIIAAIVSV